MVVIMVVRNCRHDMGNTGGSLVKAEREIYAMEDPYQLVDFDEARSCV